MKPAVTYASDELSQGTTLDNYIIQSVLGRGAFGITYLARDKNLERPVAIKEYLPSGFAKRDQESTVHPRTDDDSELFQYGLSTFLDEARTIVKFNHPNILRVLAFFEANNTAYIVMEYEEGQDLKAYLKTAANPPEQRLLEIFTPINEGLDRIHQLGYIHRDIKPGNIYIRKDNTPVLIDFGAARDIFNKRLDSLTRILTRGYAPYEQEDPAWANQGAWTDIYAMGATLHFALTGEAPVSSQERAGAFLTGRRDPYQPLVERLCHRYSLPFLQAIDHALQFQPAERPQSVMDWNLELLGNIKGADETRLLEPAEDVYSEATYIQTKPQQLLNSGYSSTVTAEPFPAPDNTVLPDNPLPSSRQTRPRFLLWVLLIPAAILPLIVGIPYLTSNNEASVLTASPSTSGSDPKTPAPAPIAEPTKPSTPPPTSMVLVTEKVKTTLLLHARDAVLSYGKILKKQQMLDKIESGSLSSLTNRTKFIVSLKEEISGYEQNFSNSFAEYSHNIQELRNYPEADIRQAVTTLVAGKPANTTLLGELLIKHVTTNTDQNLWQDDLQSLGRQLTPEEAEKPASSVNP